MTSAYDKQLLALRERRRRIIFNNDGCDVFCVPADQEPTADNLLAQRTRDLVGTHVDVMSYTSISSGFSLFTHDTRIGEVLERSHPGLGGNIAPDLIRQGRDCLRIMVDFGHEHGMEVFWSMRMNDTHDGAHRHDNPYFLFPRLKQEHPEFLMGTPEARPRYGAWSAVDYGRPEIRDLAFRFVEDVCQRYDVDGVELDFFRHPIYFRRVAAGEPASSEDCSAMTALLDRIRAMCRREGSRRGRPILVAVRTPDSFEYARVNGLDIESWMARGLIDFWVPGGYFRLNPWADSVERAHRHGVKVWAGLSESRVGGGHHRHRERSSDACYRARSLNAWTAGADGVYLFNLFDPRRRVWRELGDPGLLTHADRNYFVSVLGRKNAAGGNLPYDAYRNLPDLNPDNPVLLTAEGSFETHLTLSGIPGVPDPDKVPSPFARLWLELDHATPETTPVQVTLNGTRLPPGNPADKGLAWDLSSTQLRNGDNDIAVAWLHSASTISLLDIRLELNRKPS